MKSINFKEALCRSIHYLHNVCGLPYEDPYLEDPYLRNLLKINYTDNLLMSSSNFAELFARREQSMSFIEELFNSLFKPKEFTIVTQT